MTSNNSGTPRTAKEQTVSVDHAVWLKRIAEDALLLGGRYRVRSISSVLALLREVKRRKASKFKLDGELNSLEKIWVQMRKAGTAQGEPKLRDKELQTWLTRQEG